MTGARRLAAAVCAIALLSCAPAVLAAPARTAPAAAATSRAAGLEAEIQRLAAPAGGVVGVAAWRLDGQGPRALVNADQAFPMASTFKVAVAGAILKRVDDGALSLDQMVAVEPGMFVPSEVIADRFIHPGVSLSVHNLLELMLTQSDNTATDVLTRLAGGPAAVTTWLKAQGIVGQRVDRDTAGLLRDFFGLGPGPLEAAYVAAVKADPKIGARGDQPDPAFDDDPRDSSTPSAMGLLLTRIFNGQALSPASTTVLTDIMGRCRTGVNRLKAKLPAGTVVADKTGTIGGSVNDVGVITLPDGKGRIVVAAFIKKSGVAVAEREKALAEIGRAVHDYYLFQAGR